MTNIQYPCDFCGAIFRAQHDAEVVICPKCGYEIISEDYSYSDRDFDAD